LPPLSVIVLKPKRKKGKSGKKKLADKKWNQKYNRKSA
jgi:hypothetical protein